MTGRPLFEAGSHLTASDTLIFKFILVHVGPIFVVKLRVKIAKLCDCCRFWCVQERLIGGERTLVYVKDIQLIGAFAKLRNATISFVLYALLFAWNNSTNTGWIFMKFDI